MSDGTKLLSSVHQAFERICRRNGHAFPESQLNFVGMSNTETEQAYEREKAAYELMIAGEVVSMAKKRREAAEKHAADVGVLDGKDDVPPGQSGTLFQGMITTVTVSTNNPTTRTDITKLKTELRKLGVDATTIDKAVKSATVQNRPARRIQATPVL